MKTTLILLISLTFLRFNADVQAQGAFGDLNFESPTNLPVLNPPSSTAFVATVDAFPGWTAYAGTNRLAAVLYNGVSVGESIPTLVTTNTANGSVIAGFFTAALAAGEFSDGVDPTSLAQTGLIPAGSQSIRFFASGQVGDLTVTFNGQNVPFLPLSVILGRHMYGGDVSGYAGQTGELRFTENPITSPFSTAEIDNISFSPSPAPEPGTCALILCGAALWAVNRRSRP
jgi:hypothetical protein